MNYVSERRTGRRTRALKGAKILFNGGRSTMDCQIRNLSDQGAKLSMASTISVPDQFTIKLDQGGEIRKCQVSWRNLRELGVRFSDPE
jgi:hypothetical protein